MAIRYTASLNGIEPAMLDGGFWVNWPNPPSPATHLEILKGSYRVILAIDDAEQQVVGFITAISDGILAAYIPFLEVLPSYQGQGIGSELTQQMLDSLKHLYMIDLLCDVELQPYYERLGMQRASGMMIRNYARQSGAIEGE